MIRNTVMPLAWLMLASVIIGAAIAFASPAHADPVSNYAEISAGPICSTLDSYPSLAGLSGVFRAVEEDSGFGPYDAGRIVAMAVIDHCPRHLALLRRYVAVYAPQSRLVASQREAVSANEETAAMPAANVPAHHPKRQDAPK
ncbi:hypothetical protein [Mycobacterium xenopi]|uniref:Bacteriophage protein n=1 Tax=Mycobacterium xenopi TaxID=1789 RepID=A0AAD1M0L4_MYCXE|nr:hypothetical protein [Mycobacterium xenopi]EUA18441.1 hypothetical protein I552_9668 [Mycobacterium xenopi 3993]EUA31244.1 hypothetical protein I552_10200 [Mycobacterium xenopi 3993]ORX21624.1 hypothetical protein AWC32_21680 [Mycobacterium xenopi]SPX77971.1 bacteriophage protein [Mycobacterium xenopi]BBU22133.1 hypothetical protein MYXE_19230 [Mycobacterium xenopi]